MGLANLAIAQQMPKALGGAELGGVRARLMDALVEGDGRAEERFQAHRAGDGSSVADSEGSPQSEPANGVDRLRAVEERETFLGLKLDGVELRAFQALRAGKHFALVAGMAFTDQHKGQMGQGSEVAAGAHGAFFRNDREYAAIEKRVDASRNFRPSSTESEPEGVGAQHQKRSRFFGTERVSDAARMAADQVALKCLELIGRDDVIAEAPESGVNAVGHFPGGEQSRNSTAGFLHARDGSGREFGG
jgi:hypothetical protein